MINRSSGSRPREQGFTLIEILVALGILAIGATSALALFAAASAAHKRAIDRTNAANIAEQAFADVESALANGRTGEELNLAPPFADIASNWPGYQAQLEIYALSKDELLVRVLVYWQYRGQERREVFEQILLRGASDAGSGTSADRPQAPQPPSSNGKTRAY
ncbi:MAG: prepilin-type N-terminal cleavage/methylation domain-containing protein [Planctomycetota bacterium]